MIGGVRCSACDGGSISTFESDLFAPRVRLLVKFYSVVYVSGGEKQRND